MKRYGLCLLLCLLCGACSTSGFWKLPQCVPYAREVSGIRIYGDAHTWWGRAQGHYERGHKPKKGAVIVFAKNPIMRYGHVGVVTKLVDARTVEMTHRNWGSTWLEKRQVQHGMIVEDVSQANDWSVVSVDGGWVDMQKTPFPVSGFIYPK